MDMTITAIIKGSLGEWNLNDRATLLAFGDKLVMQMMYHIYDEKLRYSELQALEVWQDISCTNEEIGRLFERYGLISIAESFSDEGRKRILKAGVLLSGNEISVLHPHFGAHVLGCKRCLARAIRELQGLGYRHPRISTHLQIKQLIPHNRTKATPVVIPKDIVEVLEEEPDDEDEVTFWWQN